MTAMNSDYGEKPKRGRRPLQWWLLLIGFWIGVAAGVVFMAGRTGGERVVYVNAPDSVSAQMTATSIVLEATQTAAGLLNGAPALPTLPANDSMDALSLTATSIVAEATQMASGR